VSNQNLSPYKSDAGNSHYGQLNVTTATVIGASGMVGINLLQSFSSTGFAVTAVSRQNSGSRHARVRSLARHVVGDISNPDFVLEMMRDQPDVIISLAAARYYPPPDEPAEQIDVTVSGTVNLLRAIRDHSPETRLLFAGSGSVYGSSHGSLESDPLVANSLFAAAKSTAVHSLRAYREQFGVRATELRLFTPYGPWEHSRRLIPSVIISAMRGIAPALRSGLPTRDFVYVADVANAFVLASNPDLNLPACLNICSGTSLSVAEAAQKILAVLDSPLQVNVGEVANRENEIDQMGGSNHLALNELGWSPNTTFEQGVTGTKTWLEENPEWWN